MWSDIRPQPASEYLQAVIAEAVEDTAVLPRMENLTVFPTPKVELVAELRWVVLRAKLSSGNY